MGEHLPQGVGQLIGRQIEALGPDEQSALEIGSILGQAFSAVTVAAGMRLEPEAVEAILEALARQSQFIYTDGVMEWPDGNVWPRYAFRHTLYRQYLSQRIPGPRQMRLRRLIGDRLKQEDARVGEAAAHFEIGDHAQLASRDLLQMIDSSPDFIFKSRIDTFKFAHVNKSACGYYGYAPDEFLRMEIFDIEVYPPLKGEIRKLYDSARVGEVLEVYGLNRKKNGETFPVHVRFCKLDAEFALANVRKITGQGHQTTRE